MRRLIGRVLTPKGKERVSTWALRLARYLYRHKWLKPYTVWAWQWSYELSIGLAKDIDGLEDWA